MKDDLEKSKQRAFRYWYVDGLAEISMGLIFLVLGGYFWLQTRLASSSWISQLLIVFLMLFILGCGYFSRKAIVAIKDRLTYPRTGYVAYPPFPRKHRLLAAVLAAGIAAFTVLVIRQLPGSTLWVPAITSLIFAIVMLVIGLRLGLARFYLQGFFSLVLGGGLSLAGIGDIYGLSIFYTGSGAALLLAGVLVLMAYLRHSVPPREGSDAG